MGTGFKVFDKTNTNQLGRSDASAHPVIKVERVGKTYDTEWFTKELTSVQEAQIECMTGEIYRYLIGAAGGKIRLIKENHVASENVNFYSVRDIFENKKKKGSFKNFKEAFCNDIEGFMMVVFSSIFFEENDLSANNYGLKILSTPGTAENKKKFGRVTKIDHGQSLNTLRIKPSHGLKAILLNFAEVKYFPPKLPVPDFDNRSKASKTSKEKGREKIHPFKGKRRTYNITYSFLDRIVPDFLESRVDRAYIKKLTYQPSIMPFYDNRLLCILKGLGTSDHDRMEMSKYYALAKIIFTSGRVYYHIAKNSTNFTDVNASKRVKKIYKDVEKKIDENRKILTYEMAKDPDFRWFCYLFENGIEKKILAAWNLMINSSRGRTGSSERYGPGSTGINPFEAATFNKAKEFGDFYNEETVRSRADKLIKDVKRVIESMSWKTKGNTYIKIEGRRTNVPSTAGALYNHILLYEKSGFRMMRTVASITGDVYTELHRRGRFRHKTTTLAYETILGMAKQCGKDLVAMNVNVAHNVKAVCLIHPELI
jgi:hypothetical protein